MVSCHAFSLVARGAISYCFFYAFFILFSLLKDDISSVKVFMVLICKQLFMVIRSIINDYD
jgi:hypothetical protein